MREIQNDHRSGSLALARRAGQILSESTRMPPYRTDFLRRRP